MVEETDVVEGMDDVEVQTEQRVNREVQVPEKKGNEGEPPPQDEPPQDEPPQDEQNTEESPVALSGVAQLAIHTVPVDTDDPLIVNEPALHIVPQGAPVLLNELPPQVLENQYDPVVSIRSPQVLPHIERMMRFIVLGSEDNSYNRLPQSNLTTEHKLNIKCVQHLLNSGQHEEVLQTITDYSTAGRCIKEDYILQILAECANHKSLVVRKAAYGRIVSICSIPTKLCSFLALTEKAINDRRKHDPPAPQRIRKEKKEKIARQPMTINEDQGELTVNEEAQPIQILSKDLQALQVQDVETSRVQAEPSQNDEEPPPPQEKVLKKVNRTPSKSSEWGRLRRKAISQFYDDEKKDAPTLLYLMSKYKKRCGWSHKTILKYAHPKLTGIQKEAKNLVLRYTIHGYDNVKKEIEEILSKPLCTEEIASEVRVCEKYINIINEVQQLSPARDDDEERLLVILKEYGVRVEGEERNFCIVREHLPTGFLQSRKVWEALLPQMPMTALLRNLGKMTQLRLFDGDENADNLQTVERALADTPRLRSARVHPMKILKAMLTYQNGKVSDGDIGSWTANENIKKALNGAFHKSFQKADTSELATNKKFMLCLDVSHSMRVQGCGSLKIVSPAMASFAMTMVTWNIEGDENVDVFGFGDQFENLKTKLGVELNREMSVEEVLEKTRSVKCASGDVDYSLPMRHAKDNFMDIDVFIIYTNSSDTSLYKNSKLPSIALTEYNATREKGKKDAILITCAMQSNGTTIADPDNPYMIDIVGFDPCVPEVIAELVQI